MRKLTHDLNVPNLDVYDSNDPLQKAYDEGIQLAQGGKFDNFPKRARFLVRHQLAEYAMRRFPQLDIVECGSWKGHSTVMTAKLAEKIGMTGRFAVFDSFEGLSDFTPADRAGAPDPAKEAKSQAHFRADLEQFKRLVSPWPFVDVYPGWIPARFDEIATREYSFLSCDVDLYDPTLDSLKFFYPRMPVGAAIYLDDYGYKDFPGARAASDKFFAENPVSFFMRMPSGAAIAIK